MSPERRSEAGRKGGKSAQANGTAHRWDEEEAREAGRAGGLEYQRRRRTGETKSGVALYYARGSKEEEESV